MEVKTNPQFWFQMEPKPTEELNRIWEQRAADPAQGVDLAHVQQVLIARHILEPAPSFLAEETNLVDEFTVHELNGSHRLAEWEVRLMPGLAEFIGPRGQERFVINRDLSRPEFQFRRAGFLALSETSIVRVRGRLFDLGIQKTSLEDWLPPLSHAQLQRESRLAGTGLLLLGILSFYYPANSTSILGGLLVILGLVNLLAPRRAAFFADGLLLLAAGAATLAGLFLTLQSFTTAGPVLPVFWALLGLFEWAWGYQAFVNFRKFKPA